MLSSFEGHFGCVNNWEANKSEEHSSVLNEDSCIAILGIITYRQKCKLVPTRKLIKHYAMKNYGGVQI
jgi:hypothetical protein